MRTSRLLEDLMRSIVDEVEDVVLAGTRRDETDLVGAVETAGADCVIITLSGPTLPEECLDLLAARPGNTVIALTDVGRGCELWQLAPSPEPLAAPSRESLLEAIRRRPWIETGGTA